MPKRTLGQMRTAVLMYLEMKQGWVGFHELRKQLHLPQGIGGADLPGTAADLQKNNLIQTRGGWAGGPFEIRLTPKEKP